MLGDLVSSFEAVKQKAPARMADVNGLHKFLNSSYASMPTAQDTEKCVSGTLWIRVWADWMMII